MHPLRISAPTVEAAMALVEMLGHGATADLDSDGFWEVTVPLTGAGRGTVPLALAVTRQWLDELGFRSASVTLDGHTHLLRGTFAETTAMH